MSNDDLRSPSDGSDTLVVMVHGLGGSPKRMSKMRDVIKRDPAFAKADFLIPAMPFGIASVRSPYRALARLVEAVDRQWAARPYRRIHLVGQSMGGIFAKRLYTIAQGEDQRAPSEPALIEALREIGINHDTEPRPWASRVERVVLLAALNRGFTINHSLGLGWAIKFSVAVTVGRLMGAFGREPIAFAARRGSVFITQMRIQWLTMRERMRLSNEHRAVCVQLLGSVDDIVSPEDSIDLVAGRDFFYLDVPYSNHRTMGRVAGEDEHAPTRAKKLLLALGGTDEELQAEAVLPADEVFEPDYDVKRVVFVIHGIRDKGYWTHKIARTVRKMYRERHEGKIRFIATETSSYGYFPALSFIFKGRRRKKAAWLMDQYAEAKARYPEASFSFVGHSNGTYMLAFALQRYRAARFENIVFAGSVVRRQFRWGALHPDQYGRVLNYIASRDLVLAFLTKPLQRLKFFDVGAAGHDGFDCAGSAPGVYEVGAIKGGHAAAIGESQWRAIAGFILDGPLPEEEVASFAGRRNPIAVAVGIWSPLIVVAFILLLVVVFRGIAGSSWGEWERATAIIGLSWFLLLLARKA